jgi:hypothetical protein
MKPDDEHFEQRARMALDTSVERLDAATRNRLSAGRNAALQPTPPPHSRHWFGFAATAFAASLVLALVIAVKPGADRPHDLTDAEIALELALDDEASDDPDFYVWMDAVLLDEEGADHAG